MSPSLSDQIAAQLAVVQPTVDHRENVRRFFGKYAAKLNKGSTQIKGPLGIPIGDLAVWVENGLREIDEQTFNEMLEDAHKL